MPIVSAAEQHVTASDGVVNAGGATARAAFSSTDWSPPSQTPSLKGEARQVFLDQCSHWYHTPKAKTVPCRVLRVEPSGKAWVRFWAAERAVSQQRLKRDPTAAVGSFIIGLLEDEGVASGPAEDKLRCCYDTMSQGNGSSLRAAPRATLTRSRSVQPLRWAARHRLATVCW